MILFRSIIGTAIFCQLFGLAPTYTWAVIFRTCWGLMNSTVGVVKTYIGEVCNAHTVASGMALISSAGGLARYAFSTSSTVFEMIV